MWEEHAITDERVIWFSYPTTTCFSTVRFVVMILGLPWLFPFAFHKYKPNKNEVFIAWHLKPGP